jgi:cysteine desulfurase/selenocysteine lyase
MSFDRADFPMCTESLIYLDSAATALKPNCVIDAMSHFYRTSYATVHRAIYKTSLDATFLYNTVRSQVQSFLNANSSDEIIFTHGTTDGINLIARSYGDAFIKKDDIILISGQEHHSNIVPWQLLALRSRAHLKVIPLHPDGQINLAQFHKLLTPQVKLISIAHISNVLGIVNPIEEIIAAAHKIGAHVVIDAAQSAAHIPLDVKLLDCDFLVFSGHKLYGPTGIGVLYGKKDLLEKMPPYQGGGDMIQSVTFEKTTYQDPPLRFEAGTPSIAEVIGLGEALRFLKFFPDYEHHLIAQALTHLPANAQLLGPKEGRSSLITFHIPNIHPLDLATLLDLEAVALRSGHLCAQPLLNHFGLKHALRLSIAPYNTPEEIERFGAALRRVIAKLS